MSTFEKDEPLVNTITERRGGQDKEFALAPEGIALYGLVKVKNIQRFNTHRKEMQDALRFVFRSYDNPDAYVTTTVTASMHKRANLLKLIQSMTGYKFKLEEGKDNAKQAYHVIQELTDKWYQVAIQHWQTKEGQTRAGIAGYDVKPTPQEGQPCPTAYFDGKASKPAPKQELKTGFEDYEDEPPSDLEKDQQQIDFDGDDIPW